MFLDEFGVQDEDLYTNNAQDEEMDTGLAPAAPASTGNLFLDEFGAEEPPAPVAPISPEEEDPTWQDYGRMVMSGGAQIGQGVGWLLEKAGLDVGTAIKERSAESARAWMEDSLSSIGLDQKGISQQAREALQTEFLGEGSMGNKWSKAKLTAASSLLGTMAGMGLGGALTKGITATMRLEAGTAAARAAAATGYGLGEAGVAAPSAGAATQQAVEQMSLDQLKQEPAFQAAYEAFPDLPETERVAKAKSVIADAAAGKAAALTLLSTFVLSAPFSSTIGKAAGVIPGTGRVAGAVKGAAEEATQEFLQSGAEQLAQNYAVREEAYSKQALGEDVLEQAVGGAAAGGMMGGVMGGVTGAEAEEPGPGPLDDLTADELKGRVDATKAARNDQIRQAQEAAKQGAADAGADPLEQEIAAAQAGAAFSKEFQPELDRLNRLWNQRLAADEEARYFEEQQKEDAKRAEIQAAAAKRYEEGLAQIEQERQAAAEQKAMAEKVVTGAAGVKQAAVAEEGRQAEEAKAVAEKQRRIEKADMQMRKLRRMRQAKGLEPKTDEGLPSISPAPSAAEVQAFKGKRAPSTAMAEAFTRAAETAATSPTNELPAPTAKQIEAGNYKKGHAKVQGLDVTIENPAGSTREGPGWSNKMKDHYGYIKRTSSAEGETEQLDAFIGEDHASETAFVVDQLNQETGEFDEHKVMLGYPNQFAAIRAYKRNFPKGWKTGKVTAMPMAEFKQWIKTGDMTRPLQKIARPSPVVPATQEQFEEVIQAKTRKEGRRPRILFRQGEETDNEAVARQYFDDKAIEDAKQQNYKSREKLVYMSPDQFLTMAERLRFPDQQKEKEVRMVLDQFGERWNSVPILGFLNEGNVAQTVAHEGRHRAMELKRRGVKTMPVRLISQEGGPAGAIRWDEHMEDNRPLPLVMRGQSGGEIPFPVTQDVTETQPAITRPDMKVISRQADDALRGLPRAIKTVDGPKIRGPWKKAMDVAKQYMKDAGLEYRQQGAYVKVDTARAERIAAEFDKMKHEPNNPEVKAAYRAMIDETVAQYKAILKSGLKVEFVPEGQPDPYYSPQGAIDDLVQNNHLWVFSTRQGFGTDEAFDPTGNPMLEETEFTVSGQKALANDIFRIVHDYFGHAKEGVGFRAAGEENAWRAHSAMFSPLAQRALTTETRGQNSWLNYGPYGKSNRTAKTEETHFADQKIGLLPEWVALDGLDDKGYEKLELPPRSTAELATALRKEGGFSADPETGVAVTEGYAVGIGAEESIRGYAGEMFIDGYRRRHAEELAQPGHVLGGWFYNGESYLDVSRIFAETPEGLAAATALAKKNREKAIMQLSNTNEITMEYTAEELAEPVEGDTVEAVHYSHYQDLSTLEGAKYGTGIKGEEAARLAYPGFEDIVPRVYFYTGKFRKEAGLGPHEYRWKQARLYDAGKDTMRYRDQARKMAFEAGFPNGDTKAVANFFDRLVKEAGYAGVYVPEMNGTGYVFGDVHPNIEKEVLDLLRLREGALQERTITPFEVRAIVNAIQAQLPLLNVQVVNDATELPTEFYNELVRMNRLNSKGFYDIASGEIYILASNASSLKDVTSTILHEGVAHKGLRYLLGPDLPALLDDVFANADPRGLYEIARRYRLDVNDAADKRTIAEEYIAHLAERNIDSNILQKVVDAVRRVLRDLGLVHAWTDADIRALLRSTRATLRSTKPLSKIKIPSDLKVTKEGDVEEVLQTADVAIRQMDKRLKVLQQLITCVG